MKNSVSYITQIAGVASAIVFALLFLAVLPISVHAADFSEGDYGSTYISSDSSDYGSTYIEPDYTDYGSTYIAPDYSYSDYGSTYIAPDYTDYGSTYIAPDSYTYGSTYVYGGGGGYTYGGGGCSFNCGHTTPTPKPAPTCSISVNPSQVTYGSSATISWSSSNATSASLSGFGSVATGGSKTISNVTSNQNYTLTVTGAGGTANCQTNVTVIVPPPAAPSCNIYINQYSAYNSNTNYNNQYQYQPANGYVINWTSSNANYGFINNGIGSVSLSGTRTVYPTQTTVYTGTFTGQNGQTVTCSVTINVNNYVPPIVYQNPTPYVTLAAVPYTGLDLGPVGTVMYWGFLMLWCLGAAYLIAVKRVHMKIYRWYKKSLFGEEVAVHAVHATYTTHAAHAAPAHAQAPAMDVEVVDSFIVSQIHRAKRA